MTITVPQPLAVPDAAPQRRARSGWEVAAVVALLAGTAELYLWGLGASGWANGFYAAAVQAGAQGWKAFLFGSSDAANSITVDKTPAALWVMGISVRLFGLNSWSLLVPQALEGVAAVGILYAAVRRVSGIGTALLAGAILALTPAAVLIFRFDNPDALLVLLLVASAYCVLRALEPGSSRWWLPLAGVAIGFGFLAKMLQAFLVLPVFGLVYLLTADAPPRTRIARLLDALLAVIVSAGWYLALVELWPTASRPYIGGSQHNSILELMLGYNGVGRLTGDEVGGLGNLNHDVGLGRLVGVEMGGQIGWLLPAAVIGVIAGLCITRHASRTDRTRAALLLWGGWLSLTGVVFSYANGILHPYYTVALAPAIAAGVAIGASMLWRRRDDLRATTTLAGMVVITALLSYALLTRHSSWLPWLRIAILVAGLACGLLLLVVGRLPVKATRAVGVAALAVLLAGPAAYSVATAASPHRGAIPAAGPSGGHHWPGGGPMGGLLGSTEPGPELTAALSADADDYTWVAAAVGSNNAAGYQLAVGAPVMAVGGFNGTDPSPTLAQFQDYVAQHRIHYFLGESMMRRMHGSPSGSDDAERIAQWVAAAFPSRTVDGVKVYDLSA
jgi:4-amino-4-deoxy-L-arabinose transferase-like glycosyltransferase